MRTVKSIRINSYIFAIILFCAIYFPLNQLPIQLEVISLKSEIHYLKKQRKNIYITENNKKLNLNFDTEINKDYVNAISNFNYLEYLASLSDAYGFKDYSLFLSMIYVESGFKNTAQSFKNAKGLMQITTFVYDSDTNPFNEVHNIFVGISYFNYLYNQFYKGYTDENRLLFSIAAYNCGPEGVRIAQTKTKKSYFYKSVEPFLPDETKEYVKKVIIYKNMIKI